MIDLERGGNIQGIIDALNRILDITIPRDKQEGGTYVIPGHGRLCDEADVLEYRDMVTIIRDRIRDMVKKGDDAGPGEGGAADARLRRPLRRDDRRRGRPTCSSTRSTGTWPERSREARRCAARHARRCGDARRRQAAIRTAGERADRSHRLLGLGGHSRTGATA